MHPLEIAAKRLDPSLVMEELGLDPDPWQRHVLRSRDERLLMLCCRQAGKSTTTAVLALATALYEPGSLILLLSPSLRQSGELFKKLAAFYDDLGKPVEATQETALSLSLANGSRIISLPGAPDTIRGFSGVRLLVIDEAAMTSDDLFVAVSPMLAVSRGRLVCLSTPLGKRGWFYEAWESDDRLWKRIKATAEECPRIDPEFLEQQKTILGERAFRQEYLCSFEEMIGQYFSSESIGRMFEDAPDDAGLDGFTY